MVRVWRKTRLGEALFVTVQFRYVVSLAYCHVLSVHLAKHGHICHLIAQPDQIEAGWCSIAGIR